MAHESVSFEAAWADMPGLRSHLVKTAITQHAPLPLLYLLAHFIFIGSVSIWLFCWVVAVCILVQCFFHIAASSLLIVPIQNTSYRLAMWISTSNLIKKFAPSFPQALAPYIRQLQAMRADLDDNRVTWHARRRVKTLQLKTPDGCLIDGLVWSAEERTSNGKCVVYLGGNGSHYELNHAVQSWYTRGFTVVVFNYRGVGRSSGLLLRHGPVIDTCTVLAYVRRVLGISSENTVLFGHSIGGAFATEAALFVPDVFIINDRSFGTLSEFLFLKALLHVVCFELDSIKHWKQLDRARKLIVYTPEDKIIPLHAQLATMMAKSSALTDAIGCTMVMDHRGARSVDAHNCDFNANEYQRIMKAIEDYHLKRRLPDTL